MKNRASLFLVFLRIGGGMIGGGYSMLPLIQREIDQRWSKHLDFTETLPLAQALPGPLAVNLASLTGHAVAGFSGACLAVLGVTLPSLLIIGILAASNLDWKNAPLIAAAMNGMRPVAIGLITASLWRLRPIWLKGVFRPLIASLTLVLLITKVVTPLALVLIAVFGAASYAWLKKVRPLHLRNHK